MLRLYLAARAKLILVSSCCATVFLRVVAKLGLITWGANKLCCSSDRVYPMLVCIGYCSPWRFQVVVSSVTKNAPSPKPALPANKVVFEDSDPQFLSPSQRACHSIARDSDVIKVQVEDQATPNCSRETRVRFYVGNDSQSWMRAFWLTCEETRTVMILQHLLIGLPKKSNAGANDDGRG